MSKEKALACILVGAAVGTLAGLTGIGGGVFLVPLLVAVLYVPQYEAHGTSLAVIFPMALASAVMYGVNGHIQWDVFMALAAGGVVGAVLGARLMKRVPERRLQWLFGLFIICVGFVMVVTHPTVAETLVERDLGVAAYFGFILGGLVAGFLSGLMGVGGGVVLIPVMVLLMGLDQHSAQGISLAAIAVIAFFGAFTHLKQKTVRNDIAMYVAPSAVCYGLLGSFLADRIDANILRDMVGVIIIITGVLAVFRDWRAGGFAS
ncbi:MAG: sulfite exporter TauE/SafE family protein [Dehalococcoidia bacterium]